MAGVKGLDFVLIEGSFAGGTQIACQRTTSLSINGETVDITNKDSAGFRELLADAGTSSMTVSVEGTYITDSTIANLRSRSIDKSLNDYTLIYPSAGGKFDSVSFQVTSFDDSGEHNGEVTYSATLESSGTFAFAA